MSLPGNTGPTGLGIDPYGLAVSSRKRTSKSLPLHQLRTWTKRAGVSASRLLTATRQRPFIQSEVNDPLVHVVDTGFGDAISLPISTTRNSTRFHYMRGAAAHYCVNRVGNIRHAEPHRPERTVNFLARNSSTI